MLPDQVTLADVLSLESLREARAEVVVGREQLNRTVRWVHTSELVEAAALLRGGEILLTTGLGLSGRGPVAQGSYVAELAARGATGLMLELGWTFPTVPDALQEAARTHRLPLVALHKIVPFVQITEQIQTQLLHSSVGRLSAGRSIDDALRGPLLRAEGLSAVLSAAAELLRCPFVLEEDGAVVASSDGYSVDNLDQTDSVHSTTVMVLGQPWGQLHAVEPPTTRGSEYTQLVLDRTADAITLTLLRGSPRTSPRTRLRQDFLADLVRARFGSPHETVNAAVAAGLDKPDETVLTPFAVSDLGRDPIMAVHACEAAAEGVGGGFAAEVDGHLVGIAQARDHLTGQEVADGLLECLDEFMRRRGGRRATRLAVGPTVHGVEALGRGLRDACSAIELADSLDLPGRIVTTRGLVAERLLLRAVDDPALIDLLDDVLGPLTTYDEKYGTDLVQTLQAYLFHGQSKAAAAAHLHIRRQTLYKRLARIESLVGDVDEPAWRVSLVIALKAHDLVNRRRAR